MIYGPDDAAYTSVGKYGRTDALLQRPLPACYSLSSLDLLLRCVQVTGDVRGLRVGVVQEGLANCEPDVIEVRETGSHIYEQIYMVNYSLDSF